MNDVNQELRDYAKRHKAWHRNALGLPEESKAQTTQFPLPVSQTSRFNPKLVMFTVACLFSVGLLWWGLETFEKYSQSQGMGGAPPLKLDAPSLQSRTQKTITAPTNKDDLTTFHAPWGLPQIEGLQIISRKAYVFGWLPEKKRLFVAYKVQVGEADSLNGHFEDPDLPQFTWPDIEGYTRLAMVQPQHISGLRKEDAITARYHSVLFPTRRIMNITVPRGAQELWLIKGAIYETSNVVKGMHIPTHLYYIMYIKRENGNIETGAKWVENLTGKNRKPISITQLEAKTGIKFPKP